MPQSKALRPSVAVGTESGGSGPGYSVNYSYTPDGDRGTVTYNTSKGTKEWQYDNCASFGLPQNGGGCSRAPQTMRLLDQYQNPTPEEFHYIYDGGGRMMGASFAMTPASGYTPSSGQPWYTPTELASSSCYAVYDNDAGSHLWNLDYYWQNSNGTTEPFAYSYSYSLNDTTFLKTGASFNELGNQHSETYTYDDKNSEQESAQSLQANNNAGQPGLDYLTGASYGIGSNPTQSWTYDAAGNRASDSILGSYACNDLNMLTKVGSGSYSNDPMGDRQSDPSGASYGWDVMSRLASYTSGSTTTNYSYRADGMRVQKSSSAGSTSYAYDGQMGFEDVEANGSNPGTTDYAIGARGIDRLAFTNGSTTNVSYPILDGHGNMTATISESGASYSAGNSRSYDAWGNVVVGGGPDDPKGRYCANLGHKQDDESGLIYMRARYEDPVAGRFVSEDPSRNGSNWALYCDNCPTSRSDSSGRDWQDIKNSVIAFLAILLSGMGGGGGGVVSQYIQSVAQGVKYAIFLEQNPPFKKRDDDDSGDDDIEALILATIILGIMTVAYISAESGFLTNLCASITQLQMNTDLASALAT